MKSSNTIYTPKEHICLGEVIKVNGVPAIRIKKPNKDIYEVITVETLLMMIFRDPTV